MATTSDRPCCADCILVQGHFRLTRLPRRVSWVAGLQHRREAVKEPEQTRLKKTSEGSLRCRLSQERRSSPQDRSLSVKVPGFSSPFQVIFLVVIL